MNFEQLNRILADEDCNHLLVKYLAPNDNSKNQIYLGGGFEALNQIPMTDIERDTSVQAGSKKDRFKSLIDFYWITDGGRLHPAPFANLILYPRYPEVRLSGILKGLPKGNQNNLVASRGTDRILCLGISRSGKVLAWIGRTTAGLGQEIDNIIKAQAPEIEGVFHRVAVRRDHRVEGDLFARLWSIHQSGWIDSKRLDSHGKILPCRGTNCGGYTLEAELGISPNGRSEPDYDGWEIKQFSVKDLAKPRGGAITLMTPEPDGGDYVRMGLIEFVRTYGYPDKLGRPDRLNFGGIHRYGHVAESTNLKLELPGYNPATNKLERTDGSISLTLPSGHVAASWSFEALLKHWNRKHARAVYVPGTKRDTPSRQYHYGSLIYIGVGTDFGRFLHAVGRGAVYYDPGIKVVHPDAPKPDWKKRSQLRVAFKNLGTLYRDYAALDLRRSPMNG